MFNTHPELSYMNSDALTEKFSAILPLLDERQKRLYLASEARAIGHGGVTLVSEVSGMARSAIHGGLKELAEGHPSAYRVRRQGGGRKKHRDTEPQLIEALNALVSPETRGDPMSPLLWTCKSTRNLASALKAQGHRTSHMTVSRVLNEMGYSLQAPSKVYEGRSHPDRDEQFNYINERVKEQQRQSQPVLSVDTKKRELIGNFKNVGREYQQKGQPDKVNAYDFRTMAVGVGIPYGLFDPTRNEGWVSVGTDHDTSAFAVETIRRWYCSEVRQEAYPVVRELLICADGGGSNGSRVRLWKKELARFADEAGIIVTVCHLPPGTSKWNKIEHRLFAHISMNWRGRALVSHQVMVQTIAATTTRAGLKVHADLDTNEYPTKIKVSNKEMKTLEKTHVKRQKFHPEWNYSIHPNSVTTDMAK
jgi:hypothetical protein